MRELARSGGQPAAVGRVTTSARALVVGTGIDAHRAAVRRDDLAHDREAESAAAGVACASVVEPHEPLEHPLAFVGRNAVAVVAHGEHHGCRIGDRRDRERDAGGGVAGGIVDEVAHELAQQARIAVHPRGRDAARVDREPGPVAHALGLVEQQVVEVDVAAFEA